MALFSPVYPLSELTEQKSWCILCLPESPHHFLLSFIIPTCLKCFDSFLCDLSDFNSGCSDSVRTNPLRLKKKQTGHIISRINLVHISFHLLLKSTSKSAMQDFAPTQFSPPPTHRLPVMPNLLGTWQNLNRGVAVHGSDSFNFFFFLASRIFLKH